MNETTTKRHAVGRLLDRVVMRVRMARAKATGVYPCTYTTKHGHDFNVLKAEAVSGIPVVFFRCSICGLLVTYDPLTGLTA